MKPEANSRKKMSSSTPSPPSSEHFDLHHLTDGVFAAIATTQGAAYSNAGIIDLGDRTLVFDTFNTPMAARDLRLAVESLTGRQVSTIVISHVHSDHWMGNQVFSAHTTILSTTKIRAAMPEWGDELLEYKDDPTEVEEYLRESEGRLEKETDPRWRATLESSIRSTHFQLQSLPELVLRYPDLTFEGSLVFYGSQRKVELFSTGVGHSESDISLLLPDEKIAFIGDLGFFSTQPFLPYSQPEAWIKHMEMFGQTNYETYVPGHGTIGTNEDLALQRRYLDDLNDQVGAVIAAGGTREDALKIDLPAPFNGWLHGGMGRFEANVNFLYDLLSEKM